ncbi:cation diffusion facilitator family transporter [Litorisediminicola beolgyonensis]
MPQDSHAHSHAPTLREDNQRVVFWAFVMTAGFMLAELVGGLIAGSLALIADAGHMLTDAAALALAWAGFKLGRRGPDARRSFGYLRLEVIAGFVNALSLIALIAWIAWEALWRLISPAPVLAGPMLVIAALGLLVNIAVFWMLSRGDRDHLNIRGAMIHVLGDLLGSVAALLAAGLIWLTGWTPIDPILSVLLSAILLRSALSLLRASAHVLMEGVPGDIVLTDLRADLIAHVPGLAGIAHVHVWSITSGAPVATLEAQLEDGADPEAVTDALKLRLREEHGIHHATVEIDWQGRAGACVLADRLGS